jgi:hypothetical protein
MRRLILCGALLASCGAYAQEGQLASLREVEAFEQTWRRAALLPDGPMTPKPQPIVVIARKRNPVQDIIDESERCSVQWRSQRARRPSRIVCYAKR